MNSIDSNFVAVCRLADIPAGGGHAVVLDDGTEVALFRFGETVHAVTNICPHQHSPMIADGYLEGCEVTCPMHGWTFDVRTGRNIEGGAGLRRFTARVIDATVYLRRPELPRWMRQV